MQKDKEDTEKHIILGDNGKRIIEHLHNKKEKLQDKVDNRDDQAAVAAYLISMDKVIESKLTLTQREDYRWGFYDGTQWQKQQTANDAIEFARWLSKECTVSTNGIQWWYTKSSSYKKVTELYELWQLNRNK